MNGAGIGNRTLIFSLEGYCITIMLYPHGAPRRTWTYNLILKRDLLYHWVSGTKVKADFTLTWRVNRATLNKRTNGTPAKTWTWNPQIRNLMLYPVELQGHGPRGWNWTTYHSFIRTVLWPMSYSGIHGQNKPPFSGPQMAKRTILVSRVGFEPTLYRF